MKYYAGIGSRDTPLALRPLINEIAMQLDKAGYTLRSGGAPGADTFFEEAARKQEIFLPWPGFNGRNVPEEYQRPTSYAFDLASSRIPGFDKRSSGAQKLLARNMHQVLGPDLETPVEFVVCWTQDGAIIGGTAHAIRLALYRGIPVYNLGNPIEERLLQKKMEDMK